MDEDQRVQGIVRRAEQLDTGAENCLDPAHPDGIAYWEQGGSAFSQNVLLEACPYNAGAEQDDWLRGWMAAELIEFGQFEDDQP